MRDILAGISPGLDENQRIIADALGCSLAELHSEAPLARPFPTNEMILKSFLLLAEEPKKASLADVQVLFDQLELIGPKQRAIALALLAGNYEVARPHVVEERPALVSLLAML